MNANKIISTLILLMIPLLSISQEENSKDLLFNNVLELYKVSKQEENLFILATEQKEIIKDKDSIIERMLAERKEYELLQSILNERIQNKDKYIEQLEKVSKKRNISVIGFAGYGLITDFKFSPVIGVGIGIEILRL